MYRSALAVYRKPRWEKFIRLTVHILDISTKSCCLDKPKRSVAVHLWILHLWVLHCHFSARRRENRLEKRSIFIFRLFDKKKEKKIRVRTCSNILPRTKERHQRMLHVPPSVMRPNRNAAKLQIKRNWKMYLPTDLPRLRVSRSE